MKNLYLIPTDKPSRLFLNKINNKLLLDSDTYSNLEKILPSSKYQNIYITDNSEIKEGDWYYLPRTISVYKCIKDPIELNLEKRFGVAKIILSTNEYLIADGVQKINDEFLQWFVNNSSCEEVETSFACLEERQCMCKSNECCSKIGYKIIIPSEVPKQTYLDYFTQGKKYIQQDNLVILAGENETDGMVISDPKNTTGIGHYAEDWNPKAFRLLEEFINEELEEAAINRYGSDRYLFAQQREGFIEGAKWQAKRMYSEEDMLNFAWFLLENVGQYSCDRTTHFEGKYLEQFKKK
jgi:hypothetical protein